MVRRVGAGEGLAGRHSRSALARIPHGARVATTSPSARAVVEAVSFAWEIIAAGPVHKRKQISLI